MFDKLKKFLNFKNQKTSTTSNSVPTKTAKEIATEAKEPWVAVLDTHVNKDNIRNGFFELDWNEYFVLQLRSAGFTGETDEIVVEKWFQELCKNIGSESDIDMTYRSSGYVNKALRDDGRTEIY